MDYNPKPQVHFNGQTSPVCSGCTIAGEPATPKPRVHTQTYGFVQESDLYIICKGH